MTHLHKVAYIHFYLFKHIFLDIFTYFGSAEVFFSTSRFDFGFDFELAFDFGFELVFDFELNKKTLYIIGHGRLCLEALA